nr:hypothetical protein [Streptomyces sp. PSKA30]
MTVVGFGDYTYELVEGWGTALPDGVVIGQTGIVTDREGLVYLFNRSHNPLVVLSPNGEFLKSWGSDALTSAHGMYIDEQQHLWLPLQYGHAVLKYDRAGNHLMTLGTVGQPSDPDWWGDEEVAHSQMEETLLSGRQPAGETPNYPPLPGRRDPDRAGAAPVHLPHRRGPRPERRHLRHRRLRQRPGPPVLGRR